MGAELFQEDEQTGKHNEANRRYSRSFANAPKNARNRMHDRFTSMSRVTKRTTKLFRNTYVQVLFT
jgi:hypothetical protein